MKDLSDIREVKRILSRHGFHFSKALGQNFLIDPTVCPRMAEACGAGPGVGVLEIGPGFGVLTQQLAMRAEKVIAVELDKRLPAVLAETLADFDTVKIVPGDVLEMDVASLLAQEFAGLRVTVCANLPYYITSPILMKLLEERLAVESITVMVQKEAAERICAQPGSRQCGAVSVLRAAGNPVRRPAGEFFARPAGGFRCNPFGHPGEAAGFPGRPGAGFFPSGARRLWTAEKDGKQCPVRRPFTGKACCGRRAGTGGNSPFRTGRAAVDGTIRPFVRRVVCRGRCWDCRVKRCRLAQPAFLWGWCWP